MNGSMASDMGRRYLPPSLSCCERLPTRRTARIRWITPTRSPRSSDRRQLVLYLRAWLITYCFLNGALDAVRPAAAGKSIHLNARLDPDVGTVAGDPARLQQVVVNLLMNAVKFTPTGGDVQLRLQAGNSTHAHIVVGDNGQGIAAQMLPHVFERFRQADSSSTRTHGGLGLGLALVKDLVELHGGTVDAHSAGEGQGATFTVTLPLVTADGLAESPRQAPLLSPLDDPARAIVRLDGLRVLVVDDDRDALGLTETILIRAGADVRTRHSAAAALELLRQWGPNVLVSDIEMPGEDGYSLIRKIRAGVAGDGAHTPAIALTAYGRSQDRLRSLAAGFNMHVPKPVDPGELTSIIASVAVQFSQPRAR